MELHSWGTKLDDVHYTSPICHPPIATFSNMYMNYFLKDKIFGDQNAGESTCIEYISFRTTDLFQKVMKLLFTQMYLHSKYFQQLYHMNKNMVTTRRLHESVHFSAVI
jgi:hypothetical protein